MNMYRVNKSLAVLDGNASNPFLFDTEEPPSSGVS